MLYTSINCFYFFKIFQYFNIVLTCSWFHYYFIFLYLYLCLINFIFRQIFFKLICCLYAWYRKKYVQVNVLPVFSGLAKYRLQFKQFGYVVDIFILFVCPYSLPCILSVYLLYNLYRYIIITK